MFRDILQENRRTLALASPIVAGHVGQMLIGLADTAMIGKVGMVPLAACAFANTLLMVPFVFGFGVVSAVSVRASIGHGADRPESSGRALRGGLWVAATIGVLVGALAFAILPFLAFFGQRPEVNDAAGTYLMLCALSVTPALIATSSKNFCEALSRPWPPFWILLGSVFLNVFLNWILIYGNLGAPAMGLEGAGWATLFSRIAGAAAMLCYPHISRRLSSTARGPLSPLALQGEIKALVALGLPVGTMHLAEVSGFAVGSLMMGWLSVEALAAHQIAITCIATTFMVPLGLSQAVSVRVGQARGGGRTERCSPIILGGLGIAVAVMSLAAVAFIFAGPVIAGFFTTDSVLIPLAARLLLIAGFFQIIDGLQIVSSGALRGFEDVKIPMLVGIAAYWVVALPFCYALAFSLGFGAPGVWIGFSVGLAVAATALLLRVRNRLRACRAPSAPGIVLP